MQYNYRAQYVKQARKMTSAVHMHPAGQGPHLPVQLINSLILASGSHMQPDTTKLFVHILTSLYTKSCTGMRIARSGYVVCITYAAHR